MRVRGCCPLTISNISDPFSSTILKQIPTLFCNQFFNIEILPRNLCREYYRLTSAAWGPGQRARRWLCAPQGVPEAILRVGYLLRAVFKWDYKKKERGEGVRCCWRQEKKHSMSKYSIIAAFETYSNLLVIDSNTKIWNLSIHATVVILHEYGCKTGMMAWRFELQIVTWTSRWSPGMPDPVHPSLSSNRSPVKLIADEDKNS